MRILLVLLLALGVTEASAQFSSGTAKSRVVPPAIQRALHQAMVHMRFEAACREYLGPSQREALRRAATQPFLRAGYRPDGAEAAVRELDAMMAGKSKWTAAKCSEEYAAFQRQPAAGAASRR